MFVAVYHAQISHGEKTSIGVVNLITCQTTHYRYINFYFDRKSVVD